MALLWQSEQTETGSEAEPTLACHGVTDGRQCWEIRQRNSQGPGHLCHDEDSGFYVKGDGCSWKIGFGK